MMYRMDKQIPRMTAWAIVSVMGLGVLVGCTGNSDPEPTVKTGPTETYPEAEDSSAAPDPASETDTSLVFYEDDQVAIRGFDPVAYFEQGQPVKGDEAFRYEWGNTTWLFANAEHRDRFASNPQQYAPEFGGFCAWAVSQGYTAPIDPEAWTIVDGKLYLNASKGIRQRWAQDVSGNIAKGNQNWPGIRNGLVSQ